MNKLRLTLCFIMLSILAKAQDYPISTRISFQKDNINIQAYIQPFDKKEVKVNESRSYYFYYHNSIQQLQGGYMGDLLNGEYKELDENHHLRKAGKFEQGVKCGKWKEWDVNGALLIQSHYKKGMLHGKKIGFSNQGRIATVAIYRNGIATGKKYILDNGKKVKVDKEPKKSKEKKVKTEKKDGNSAKIKGKKIDKNKAPKQSKPEIAKNSRINRKKKG